jgi:hypothetical protein
MNDAMTDDRDNAVGGSGKILNFTRQLPIPDDDSAVDWKSREEIYGFLSRSAIDMAAASLDQLDTAVKDLRRVIRGVRDGGAKLAIEGEDRIDRTLDVIGHARKWLDCSHQMVAMLESTATDVLPMVTPIQSRQLEITREMLAADDLTWKDLEKGDA